MQKKSKTTTLLNRKAFHDYEILEKFEAGLVLQGTEVKSVRMGKVSFKDSYVRAKNGELWVVNLHISEYSHGSAWNHDPARPRKLLLHHREVKRLIGKIEEQGLTLVPLSIYFKNGYAKVELGLGRGRKLYDKRHEIAKRDVNRDIQRELKHKMRAH
ncbi:SsrA-binding protein SmpB [candidate division KSB1 bacterium]|nr:SsrA-binding protein SmpB [candidate division KSB1 bacterium]